MPGKLENRHNQERILYGVLFVVFLLIFIPIILSVLGIPEKKTVPKEKKNPTLVALEKLEKQLAKEQATANQLVEHRKTYDKLQHQYNQILELLPDTENLYGWATEKIFEAARKAGIQQIDYNQVYKAAHSDSPYQPYTLEVICETSYEKMIRFTSILEENPLARITRLEMTGGENPPYAIKTVLQVEWPTGLRWKNV